MNQVEEQKVWGIHTQDDSLFLHDHVMALTAALVLRPESALALKWRTPVLTIFILCALQYSTERWSLTDPPSCITAVMPALQLCNHTHTFV